MTVADAAVTVPALEKTYQKLTIARYGTAGTVNWEMTGNGKYAVTTSNKSENTIAAGHFASGVNMATTDFVMETKVEAAGNTSVIIGLVLNGKRNGAGETAIIGLINNTQQSCIYKYTGGGWLDFKDVAAYDHTSFYLRIVKEGSVISFYMRNTTADSWTLARTYGTTQYDFTGLTEANIGLGFYRPFDVTFSEYSYQATETYAVSGTISDGSNGTVTATNADGKAYAGTLTNGSYSLNLPNGTYKLYFDCGTTEGLIPAVTVADAAVTAPALAKTYQKLLGTHVAGTNTGKWVLTDNGTYAVQTTNASTDGITMGYFAEGVDMNTTDFVIETDVQAAGTKSVMLGLALNGTNGSYTNATMVFGLNNANTTAQLRTFYTGSDWPANGFHSSVAYADGDRTNFHLKIVKSGATVSYFIDGAEVATCVWGANDFNFGTWTNVKIGLGFYRSYDVTFSNYSYTETTAE